MRRFAVPTLFLVFALVSGACAGRQSRTRSIPVPPRAEITAPVLVAAPAAEAPVVVMALAVDSSPVASAKEEPASVPEVAPVADPTPVASAKEEPKLTTQRSINQHVAREIVAKHPRSAPKTAPAVEDDGREAAAGYLAVAPPTLTQALSAPAAPSILPAPQGATTVITAGPATDHASQSKTVSLFIPDPNAIRQSRAYWSAYLLGAFMAACIGILCGFYAAWRRDRRLRAIAARPYDHLPNGAILLQEVVGGVVVSTNVILPDPLPLMSEPAASEQEAKMDDIEHTWHAEGDAMQQQDEPALAPPPHDFFDLTDAFESEAPHLPPDPPLPTERLERPTPDVSPRFASGSGQIISSSDEVLTVSGETRTPDLPRDPTPRPETYPSVIYDDASATSN